MTGVPEYSAEIIHTKKYNYCLCIFVINEGARLLAQLDKTRDVAPPVDIIVADGGSTDGSVSRDKLVPRNVRAVLVKKGPGKLSAQMRMALRFALDEGYRGIVAMDGNDKDDPSPLASFVEALESGVDFIQGSRFVPGGRAVRTPLLRWIGIRLVHAPMISLASGFHYTDTTNGFRGFSARLLTDPRVAPFRDVFSSYELHYYLAVKAARLGFRVQELPVTRMYPEKGPAPTKIHGLAGNLNVLRDLFRVCLGAYDPEPDREHESA